MAEVEHKRLSTYRYIAKEFICEAIAAAGSIPVEDSAQKALVEDAFDLADLFMNTARERKEKFLANRDAFTHLFEDGESGD